jgi:hypothetical protein
MRRVVLVFRIASPTDDRGATFKALPAKTASGPRAMRSLARRWHSPGERPVDILTLGHFGPAVPAFAGTTGR